MNEDAKKFKEKMKVDLVTIEDIEKVLESKTNDKNIINKVDTYAKKASEEIGCSKSQIFGYFRRGIYNVKIINLVEKNIGVNRENRICRMSNTFEYKCAIANMSQYNAEELEGIIQLLLQRYTDPLYVQEILSDIEKINELRDTHNNRELELI